MLLAWRSIPASVKNYVAVKAGRSVFLPSPLRGEVS
jgi:hypothetical protein